MSNQPYPNVDPRPSFPAIERRILDFWAQNKTFERSVESRDAGPDGSNEYVFYDGPPFANGLPHYGHLLTGYVKDVVPRYMTMRGLRVERRFGWDTHGLPVEIEVEKELDVSGRNAITNFGIENFNSACKTSVMRYTNEWQRYVTRQARWVDFTNDYKTMDITFMESVMWAFKQLWDKGLIYEALRVMPYSWGAETPLSNFEIRLDDATRPRQDPALTVAFSLVPDTGDLGPTKVLAWTTTPWTLPSNLALAVGPDIEYTILEEAGEYYILGAATLEKYQAQLKDAKPVGKVMGAELLGRKYQPLFPYFADTKNAFQIIAGDFIDTTDGTGVVHIAPGFGEDDQRIAQEAGIPLVVPVDDSGKFTTEVPEWAGVNVFDANPDIIRYLKDQGRVVKHETYEHNYPHCWRTGTPIIYRAISSWYVEVTKFRDRMVELNQQINWIPDHVKEGQFGKWIANARDWSISRNRFWGSPIPIWRSDDPRYPRIDVYGSLDELERDFGVRPDNLHRPFIDELVRPNPDDPTGQSMMRRVPEVLDCWFESGSMPFAQVHYPFENKEWFDNHHPGDFIVEYVAQTRGWFYTLHVLATALFDTPAFKNVICHGVVLDHEGKKLSKSKRNYPDPEDLFEDLGADALRWFLMSSPILRGGDLRIAEDGRDVAEVVRQVMMPIWNAYLFFTLYANADGRRASLRTDSNHVLDRYILAKTHELVVGVTKHLDNLDLATATQDVSSFIDALNNWYIRRSRERFWGSDNGAGSGDAQDTLYTVLTVLMRVVAPLLPLISEEIYKGLTGEESVHLTDWPDVETLPANTSLVEDMDRVRDVCTAALFLREENGLRTRLPLASLVVAGRNAERLAPYVDLIKDEVNVKEVLLSDNLAEHAEFVLKPIGRILGPKLGGDVQKVLAAARNGEWTKVGDDVQVAGHTLSSTEFDLSLRPKEGSVGQALRSNDAVAILDTHITAELKAEGQARDLVRLVQQARKDADLNVTDRIALNIQADTSLEEALMAHEAWIAAQVLATATTYGDEAMAGTQAPTATATGSIDDMAVSIAFSVASNQG